MDKTEVIFKKHLLETLKRIRDTKKTTMEYECVSECIDAVNDQIAFMLQGEGGETDD